MPSTSTRRGGGRKKKEPTQVGLSHLGSYEQVLAAFRRYDRDLNGCLDFEEMHKLMVDLNRDAGVRWTEVESERLFAKLDRDHNATVDINEFIEYVFRTPMTKGTIGDAGKSDYEMVLQDFRKFDTNKNGTLDKDEFTMLMATLNSGSGGWDAKKTAAVFRQVDVDHSGEVDLNELVAFLFGVPKSRGQNKLGGHDRASKGFTEDGAMVVVEFLIGPGGPETIVKQIAGVWNKNFGHEVVVKKRVDRGIKGIVRVSARDGSLVFWDEPKMAPYRENPFLSLGGTREWVDEMTKRHLPRLLEGTHAIVDARR